MAKRIIAELTMPNVGSWNKVFTGKENIYTVNFGNYYYNFGDGWGANVEIRYARPRERVTGRFCQYEWMVDSIKKHGKIMVEKR